MGFGSLPKRRMTTTPVGHEAHRAEEERRVMSLTTEEIRAILETANFWGKVAWGRKDVGL
jgi:hypothetical protein